MLELKKYREVIFHDTREWYKIWRKTNLWFGKWHLVLWKFSSEHTSLKIGTLLGLFIQIRKCMSLKFTRELCYDNEWCKIWNGSDSSTQNLHEEFHKFWLGHSKISKMSTLVGCFWPKYMFELRKYRGVKFDGTQDWYKVWRKTDLCFQKWHEKFSKFSPEHLKVSKLGFWWHPFIGNVWA